MMTASLAGPTTERLFFITEENLKINILVDTGAEVSVLPKYFLHSNVKAELLVQTAANNELNIYEYTRVEYDSNRI